MFLIVFGIIGIVVFSIIRAASQTEVRTSAAHEQRFMAVVVAKRMQMTGGEHASTNYYTTFELPNGERMELAVSGWQYGQLAEGDSGVLARRGSHLVSFERRADRFSNNAAPANAALRMANANAWHKCEACGATFKGTVCDYCGTPAGIAER